MADENRAGWEEHNGGWELETGRFCVYVCAGMGGDGVLLSLLAGAQAHQVGQVALTAEQWRAMCALPVLPPPVDVTPCEPAPPVIGSAVSPAALHARVSELLRERDEARAKAARLEAELNEAARRVADRDGRLAQLEMRVDMLEATRTRPVNGWCPGFVVDDATGARSGCNSDCVECERVSRLVRGSASAGPVTLADLAVYEKVRAQKAALAPLEAAVLGLVDPPGRDVSLDAAAVYVSRAAGSLAHALAEIQGEKDKHEALAAVVQARGEAAQAEAVLRALGATTVVTAPAGGGAAGDGPQGPGEGAADAF